MIELTINGKKVETEKGSTILQAALGNGIKIPHLCYDKRLLPYGGCRLCIVEI
ncbi:MAG: (2Fe-2S)-binding protein [Nitrospirae bacterium]|nr:(2Fe-2S)-binding protein [Nitrospirota bacterium]